MGQWDGRLRTNDLRRFLNGTAMGHMGRIRRKNFSERDFGEKFFTNRVGFAKIFHFKFSVGNFLSDR